MNDKSPMGKLEYILNQQKENLNSKRNKLLEMQVEINNLQKNLEETQAQIQALEDKVELGDLFVFVRKGSFFEGVKLLATKDENGLFRLIVLDGTERGNSWTHGVKDINLVFGLQPRSHFKKI